MGVVYARAIWKPRCSHRSSIDLEAGAFLVQVLHFCLENRYNILELVLVADEAASKEGKRVLEELVVVLLVEDGWLYVADEVLEERTDHYVDDLADLEVDCRSQSGPRMEHLEVLAARDVLLGGLQVQLVQRSVRKLVRVDGRTEVERDIVHEESATGKPTVSKADESQRWRRLLTT